jgi:hypothetical protein
MSKGLENSEFLPVSEVKMLKESLSKDEMILYIEKKTEERKYRLKLKYYYAWLISILSFIITFLKVLF